MRCLFLFLFVVASLSACKKTEETPVIQPTQKDLLTRSQWREVGHTMDHFGTNRKKFTGGNVYDSRPACRRDHFLSFHADYTFVVDEGATRCTSTAPQQIIDTWSLPGTSGTSLAAPLPYVFAPGTLYTILELSETTLTVSYSWSDYQYSWVEEICYEAF